jgi:hypothetical protein
MSIANMAEARGKALVIVYQWRKPAVIVLDLLSGLRVFCGPHSEYLESEPQRYHVMESVSPEGVRESLLG